ncbi:MAG: hypothetical protein LBT16_13025 [Treponema sp.]|nr:hypothetical protein [Treponema sp.]
MDKAKLLRWRWYRPRLAGVMASVLIGFATGFAVALFRLALMRADRLRIRLYGALRELPLQRPPALERSLISRYVYYGG